MTPITCSCDGCKRMCAASSCLPTPAEARALIRRGYGARLSTYAFAPDPESMRYVGPSPKGQEGARDLWNTACAACTFHTDDGRCELHDLGLKPLEGRIAHHDRPFQQVRLHVMATWKGRQFESVRAALDRVR